MAKNGENLYLTNTGIYDIIYCTKNLKEVRRMLYKVKLLLAGYRLTSEERFLKCARLCAEELSEAESAEAYQLIAQAETAQKEKVG